MVIASIKYNNLKNKKSEFTDYFIVILSITVVNPFFANITNLFLFFFLLYLVFIAVNRKVIVFETKVVWILIFVYALIGIQGFIFNGISYAALYLPLNLFLLPYIIFRLLGIKFFKYFIQVLYFVAIFTMPIWFLQSVSGTIDKFISDLMYWVFQYSWGTNPRSLLIYTSPWDKDLFNYSLGIYRNSGIFHEPGAYAVFLNIGLILNTLITGKYFDTKNNVFIFCILTTLSTAGYLTLFIILLSYLFKQKISPLIKVIALGIFLFISFKTYQSEEFLQSKVKTQYEDQLYAVQNKLGTVIGQSGRFFAFYTSFQQFLENPFFGRGILIITNAKTAGEMHQDSSYTYGFMGLLATYGVFFGFFYLYYLFKGLKKIGQISNQKTIFVLGLYLAVLMLLSTQVFITTTVVVVIFIVGISNKKLEKLNIYNQKP